MEKEKKFAEMNKSVRESERKREEGKERKSKTEEWMRENENETVKEE